MVQRDINITRKKSARETLFSDWIGLKIDFFVNIEIEAFVCLIVSGNFIIEGFFLWRVECSEHGVSLDDVITELK